MTALDLARSLGVACLVAAGLLAVTWEVERRYAAWRRADELTFDARGVLRMLGRGELADDLLMAVARAVRSGSPGHINEAKRLAARSYSVIVWHHYDVTARRFRLGFEAAIGEWP